MTNTTQPVIPLRQRMIEDIKMHKLSYKTQTTYIRAVTRLADHPGQAQGSLHQA
ncbi:hypothetical protein PN836_011600 [Ningiella sp. W23]|uniref:hypothetical protein n=1 Tax=Ningiella sp. W23 TaxID=3023715 RepID=UPI0037581473